MRSGEHLLAHCTSLPSPTHLKLQPKAVRDPLRRTSSREEAEVGADGLGLLDERLLHLAVDAVCRDEWRRPSGAAEWGISGGSPGRRTVGAKLFDLLRVDADGLTTEFE